MGARKTFVMKRLWLGISMIGVAGLGMGCAESPAINEWYEVAPGVSQRVTEQGATEQVCVGEDGFTWLVDDLKSKLGDLGQNGSQSAEQVAFKRKVYQDWLDDAQMRLDDLRARPAAVTDDDKGSLVPLAYDSKNARNSQCTVVATAKTESGRMSGEANVDCSFWNPQMLTATVAASSTNVTANDGGAAWGWFKHSAASGSCSGPTSVFSHASANGLDVAASVSACD